MEGRDGGGFPLVTTGVTERRACLQAGQVTRTVPGSAYRSSIPGQRRRISGAWSGCTFKTHGLMVCLLMAAAVFSQSVAGQALRYDFQPATGALETGFIAVSHQNLYSPTVGYGFVQSPARSVDGSGKTWNFFGRIVTLDQAIPTSVLSDATRDSVLIESPP